MDPELWQRLTPLFDAALEIPKEKRSEFVAQACGENSELKQELERLLSANDQNTDTFDDPLVNLHDFDPARKHAFSEGDMLLGRYRIIRIIGEGGMGAVYEAEQDSPRRRVALKVIKAALASPDLLRRFQQEFQALGRLQHPGIAQIYDAGSAETAFGSQPFFAMELIHGKPLSIYADEHQLDTRQRLALMIQICEAVQHAHQRGIIHRDLKPGNILVDESGQPKILDFGLARMTDSDVEATRQTDIGQILGTLHYMSPEQTTGDPLALDTRSDVYALGVILYELLAGEPPYEVSRLMHEVVRTIQQVDPKPLSSVNRMYRGDIETIVGKALEKEKERRYASASDLAADIRRYLDDKPITAKPASASYQLRKFARRHKGLVAGVAAVLLVLVLGVIASTWEAVKARRAEARAQTEAATAQAVDDFLQKDLLARAGASAQSVGGAKPDPDIKVRTALDRAADHIQGKFDKQPEVEAAIRNTVGETYYDLGLYPQARKQLDRALELRRQVLGPENPKTLETMNFIARVAGHQEKYAEAVALLTQTIEIESRVLGPEHPKTLASIRLLGFNYFEEGKLAQAETLSRRMLEIQRRVLGPEDPDTVASMQGLANIYGGEAKFAQAEVLHSEALSISRRLLGPEHPTTLESMTTLAQDYAGEGHLAQSEVLLTQALEIYRRVLGPEHPNTLHCMDALAVTYVSQGKYAQAAPLFQQTIAAYRRLNGSEEEITLIAMGNLANVYFLQGNYAQADALYHQTIAAQRRVVGPEHPETLQNLADMSFMYQLQRKYELAGAVAARALAGRRHTLGDQDPDTMTSASDLALAYECQGRFAQSEPLAREAFETDKTIQPNDWHRYRAESLLGASLAGEQRYEQAEPLLIEGYQGMVARKDLIEVPNRYHLDRAHESLVRFYERQGKPEKAAEWKQK